MTDKFIGLIEYIVFTTKKKVVIITHSLGSKWLLHILNTSTQEWKDKHIKSWIPISPVYNGSAKILKALISGDNAGIPIISNIEVFI